MEAQINNTIDTAFEAWRSKAPTELEKVLMLAFVMGLLAQLEKQGELSNVVARHVVRALEGLK